MTDAIANFEKYFAGEPLSEELAALRRGDANPQPEPVPAFTALLEAFAPHRSADDDDRPISHDERLVLRQAQQTGGVTTLTRLLRKSLRAKIQLAILDSENNPLGRASEIAESWAYIRVYRQLILEVERMVAAAIKELDEGQA